MQTERKGAYVWECVCAYGLWLRIIEICSSLCDRTTALISCWDKKGILLLFLHPNKRPTPPSKPLLTEAIPFIHPNKRSTLIQDHFCLRLFPSYFHISESSWPRNTRLLRRLLRLRERIIKMQQKEPKCYSGGKPLFSSNKPTVKQHTEVKAPISSAKMTVKQYT